ncbi:MAG: hypothetical protein EA361_16330 [Bacteroidetes bacterium]|nr:MAG: hypothetical protein EA361_16330 [Bacteroidota bacterium]
MYSQNIWKQLPQKRLWVFMAGFSLALLHQVVGEVHPAIDYTFFGFFVLLVGIPHGAIDHLVEEKYHAIQKKSFSLGRFLLKYVLQILAYGLLWLIMPALSLLLFLLISAWHFGESDMQPAPRHSLWKVNQLLLGSLVLFYILMREPAFTGDLIYRITRESNLTQAIWAWAASNAGWLYGVSAFFLVLTGYFAQRAEPLQWQQSKWISFLLIMALIYFLPLLPAFALYFGGWHSLNTFGHMSGFLDNKKTIWQLWKAALPFTLLAIFFLAVIAYVWSTLFSHIDPLPILFIFIAVITLPHLLVMNKMFSVR